jgi:hypothetical protein
MKSTATTAVQTGHPGLAGGDTSLQVRDRFDETLRQKPANPRRPYHLHTVQNRERTARRPPAERARHQRRRE